MAEVSSLPCVPGGCRSVAGVLYRSGQGIKVGSSTVATQDVTSETHDASITPSPPQGSAVAVEAAQVAMDALVVGQTTLLLPRWPMATWQSARPTNLAMNPGFLR